MRQKNVKNEKNCKKVKPEKKKHNESWELSSAKKMKLILGVFRSLPGKKLKNHAQFLISSHQTHFIFVFQRCCQTPIWSNLFSSRDHCQDSLKEIVKFTDFSNGNDRALIPQTMKKVSDFSDELVKLERGLRLPIGWLSMVQTAKNLVNSVIRLKILHLIT